MFEQIKQKLEGLLTKADGELHADIHWILNELVILESKLASELKPLEEKTEGFFGEALTWVKEKL